MPGIIRLVAGATGAAETFGCALPLTEPEGGDRVNAVCGSACPTSPRIGLGVHRKIEVPTWLQRRCVVEVLLDRHPESLKIFQFRPDFGEVTGVFTSLKSTSGFDSLEFF